MVRRVLIASLLACALAAGLAASAHAAASPVVTEVRPLNLAIGETLTIDGRGFLPGAHENTVVFQRDDGEPVFVRADDATRTTITIVVPLKLLPFLAQKDGAPSRTRFRLRVLSRRLGRAFTKRTQSPKIGPPRDESAGGNAQTNLEEVSAGRDGHVTDPTDPCDPNPLSAFCPQHGGEDG
jgi:hypothetical protein